MPLSQNNITTKLTIRSIEGREWFINLLGEYTSTVIPKDEFCAIIRHALTRFGLDHKTMAHEFGVSQSTISRWASCATAPLEKDRRAMIDQIRMMVERQVEKEYRKFNIARIGAGSRCLYVE